MVRLHYHLSEGNGAVLSLEFVNDDADVVYDVAEDKRTDNTSSLKEYRCKVEEFSELQYDLYCLYEAQLYRQNYWDVESILSDLSSSEESLVLPAIDAFEGIQKEWESDGKDVKWYKEPEIDKIISAIDRVEFGETVPEVGGQILSSFITEHPLPNANHRVALSYLEMYLSMYDPDFELPKTGITGQWEDWARNYVYKSKRIMTLARKTGLLRTLRDYGADEVLRDGDNVIEFADYNLDRDNYLHYHKYEHHLDESIAFTTGVLDRTGNPELLSKEDRGREEFIERLSS